MDITPLSLSDLICTQPNRVLCLAEVCPAGKPNFDEIVGWKKTDPESAGKLASLMVTAYVQAVVDYIHYGAKIHTIICLCIYIPETGQVVPCVASQLARNVVIGLKELEFATLARVHDLCERHFAQWRQPK